MIYFIMGVSEVALNINSPYRNGYEPLKLKHYKIKFINIKNPYTRQVIIGLIWGVSEIRVAETLSVSLKVLLVKGERFIVQFITT